MHLCLFTPKLRIDSWTPKNQWFNFGDGAAGTIPASYTLNFLQSHNSNMGILR